MTGLIQLIAELDGDEGQLSFYMEWLRTFVVFTLGLKVIRLEILSAETKGENDGSE